MPVTKSRAARQRIVDGVVALNIRADIEKLKRDLLTPFPESKFAGKVFLRALGAINLLQRDIQQMHEQVLELTKSD